LAAALEISDTTVCPHMYAGSIGILLQIGKHMTNHEMIAEALRNHRGQTLTTGEIRKIVLRAYPLFSEGSLLPNDHSDEGNECPVVAPGLKTGYSIRLETGFIVYCNLSLRTRYPGDT